MNTEKFIKGEAEILHVFADTGVECEVLSKYGNITRVGINPINNPFTDNLIKADATQLPIDGHFDLSVWHPPCQRWSIATQGGGKGRDSHPNYIPESRKQAKEISDEYVIENVPNAPLEDPIYLNGRMFGLPIYYERAFETSWDMPQPSSPSKIDNVSKWDADRGTKGWAWIGNKNLWLNAKGYSYDWPAEPIKKSSVPRPYLEYLLRPLIDNWDGNNSVTKEGVNSIISQEKSIFDF